MSEKPSPFARQAFSATLTTTIAPVAGDAREFVFTEQDFDRIRQLIYVRAGIALTPNKDLFDFITNPASVNGAVLGFASGGKQTLTIGTNSYTVGGVQALVKAIQQNSKANILATPQIIALDNTDASFDSTEKIPATLRRVAPSVFRITTSRMRLKRVPATLDARIITPARIVNSEMKRITRAI